MEIKRKKILLIGPVPPPAGGVSVHLWRLRHLLSSDFDIELIDESRKIKQDQFNIRQMKPIGYLRRLLRSDILSVHSGLNALRFFHIVAGKLCRKKIILTLHAYPKEKASFIRWIDEFMFGSCDIIISVNNEILDRLTLPENKTVVQYAFLPPVLKEEKELPKKVQDIIDKSRALGKYIICSNAWRLDRFNDQDVYGLDMCIESVKALKSKGYLIQFIFNISTIDMFSAQFEAYQSQINEAGLADDFALINEELSFVKMMEQADLVVRPTNTDGDSLTIWEAIYLDKPIISSNVVNRPKGTVLFNNRDQNDFEMKLIQVLENLKNHETHSSSISYQHYKDLYTNLFGRLIKNT
ncbi:hypothetical protein [Flavihumibacter fluvii]|uniref:hypothetical protein n=1 Tax=Flavihumibacter fluvii TaxID=2838157 RepID=UPI001BDED615|nr:hypothetical protein [Flavihumibacter fluvii]ULQ54434.1 hypothetical protein KJS93_08900 [Flavihumibacter fluvii]